VSVCEVKAEPSSWSGNAGDSSLSEGGIGLDRIKRSISSGGGDEELSTVLSSSGALDTLDIVEIRKRNNKKDVRRVRN
jgi:hypothetical protein